MPRIDNPTVELDTDTPDERNEYTATITETICHRGMGEIERTSEGNKLDADVWHSDRVQRHVDSQGRLWWRNLDAETTNDLFEEMGGEELVLTGAAYEPVSS